MSGSDNVSPRTSVLVPVTDLADSVEFYVTIGGYKEQFRDGDRFAMLVNENSKLMLLGGDERIVPRVALNLQYAQLSDWREVQSKLRGLKVIVDEGPHETRHLVTGPDGEIVVVSTPRTE